MALTFTKRAKMPPLRGGMMMTVYDITFDTAGPTWAVTAANVGLPTNGTLLAVIPAGGTPGGYGVWWDRANALLRAYEEADGAAAMGVADAGDLNGTIITCLCIGYGG